MTAQRLIEQQCGQSGRRTTNRIKRLIAEPQHDDAWVSSGWMSTDVTEMQIERHQRPSFRNRNGQETFIVDASQLLVASQRNIMPCRLQHVADQVRHVLVELDSCHDYAGTGTMRSRARSAA